MTDRRLILIVAAAAFALHIPFLAVVDGVHYDDAYIFFKYADNVLDGNGWSFTPGQPSAGATSVPWTLLLIGVAAVAGDALPLAVKLIGAVLTSLAAGCWAAVTARLVGRAWIGALTGWLIAANPGGILLAVSGMDTALMQLLLALGALEVLRHGGTPHARLGLIGGLLFATRPDVGGAFAVAAVAAWAASRGAGGETWPPPRRARGIVGAALAGLAAVIPVLAFGLLNSGHALPPTRVGKMIGRLPLFHDLTYAEFTKLDLPGRLGLAVDNVAALFGTARGGFVMAPGAVVLVIGLPVAWLLGVRRAGDRPIAAFLWTHAAVLLALLCFVFPVPIPRYASPLIPLGTVATMLVATRLLLPRLEAAAARSSRAATRIVAAAVLVVLVAGVGATLAMARARFAEHAGAQQIRREVGEWLAVSTAADALIAVEPIGEIGYYAERSILDLGGLTDTGAWDCLRDGYDNAECLMRLFDERGVDWLVDYPAGDAMSVHPMTAAYPERFRHVRTFTNVVVVHEIYEVVPISRPPR